MPAPSNATLTQFLDLLHHRDGVLRRDLAHLQIGAGGEAAAVALRQISDARELPSVEDAVVNAQAAHVGILRRRQIKQPVVAPAEIVRRLRKLIVGGLLLQPSVGVERMFFTLQLLLVGELAAGGQHAILRR